MRNPMVVYAENKLWDTPSMSQSWCKYMLKINYETPSMSQSWCKFSMKTLERHKRYCLYYWFWTHFSFLEWHILNFIFACKEVKINKTILFIYFSNFLWNKGSAFFLGNFKRITSKNFRYRTVKMFLFF